MSKIPAYALVKVSRAIDFGEITPGCNLSAIGLRDGIAAKQGECQKAKSPSPGVKIVRALKHYSAAYRVSLLRHPLGGNTRSRTKTQAQTPKPTPAAPSILTKGANV